MIFAFDYIKENTQNRGVFCELFFNLRNGNTPPLLSPKYTVFAGGKKPGKDARLNIFEFMIIFDNFFLSNIISWLEL